MRKYLMAASIGMIMTAAGAAADADAAEVKWRYFGAVPASHEVGAMVKEGFVRVRERTDGRVSIEYIFFAETPYKAPEGPSLIRDGLVDMVEWLPAYGAATYPLLTGPELVFAAPTYEDTAELHRRSESSWENPLIQDYEKETLDQFNAVRVTRIFYDPMNLWFKGEFNDIEDFQGKKIRAISPEQSEFLTAVGASPVAIPATEVYTALQRGLVDGTIIGSSAIESFKLREVVDTGYILNLQVLSTGLLASKRSLDQLSEEDRQIFMEEMKAVEQRARSHIIEQEKRDIANFEETGMKVVRPSPETYARYRQIAEDIVWPQWAERAGERSQQFLKDAMQGAGQ